LKSEQERRKILEDENEKLQNTIKNDQIKFDEYRKTLEEENEKLKQQIQNQTLINNNRPRIAEEREKEASRRAKEAEERFEFGNCSASGRYYQFNRPFEMRFDSFCIKDKRISSRGHDVVGHFSMNGSYDSEGKIEMIKQYVGAHVVVYKGSMISTFERFVIDGRWNIDGVSDNFRIEGNKT
jgi:hypothetical protein